MTRLWNALKGRGNQTAAVQKLLFTMAQANQTFDTWQMKVNEEAKILDRSCGDTLALT